MNKASLLYMLEGLDGRHRLLNEHLQRQALTIQTFYEEVLPIYKDLRDVIDGMIYVYEQLAALQAERPAVQPRDEPPRATDGGA